jgi:diacylglycerol diphosphate phosphatase/phosphatidate phosphatase
MDTWTSKQLPERLPFSKKRLPKRVIFSCVAPCHLTARR